MRRIVIFVAMAIFLAGCGDAATPLTHALAAFRAGDHDALLAAKTQAQDALKTAIQPGGDLCQMTMMDVEKYGAVDVIAKLDQPEIFRMKEDMRFVYAMNLAGSHLVVAPGGLLSHAPLVESVANGHGETSCAGEKDRMMTAMMAAGPQAQDADEARMVTMRDWQRDLKSRYGDKFDASMRSAANYLAIAGYTVRWPANIDFIE